MKRSFHKFATKSVNMLHDEFMGRGQGKEFAKQILSEKGSHKIRLDLAICQLIPEAESEEDFTELRRLFREWANLVCEEANPRTIQEEACFVAAAAWALEDERIIQSFHQEFPTHTPQGAHDWASRLGEILVRSWLSLAEGDVSSVSPLVDVAREEQEEGEAEYMSEDLPEGERHTHALACLSFYHHLAAVEKLSHGEVEECLKHLDHADASGSYMPFGEKGLGSLAIELTQLVKMKRRHEAGLHQIGA